MNIILDCAIVEQARVELPWFGIMAKRERIRDPIHDLISFDADGIDHLLWELLNTEAFQRLRRIKQLGLSELVYPGATHTRFAHCVGVCHTARQLLGRIKRYRQEERRACIAVCAALLHDIGHGPFSHVFQDVMIDLKMPRRHEEWTADIVSQDEDIIRILDARDKELKSEIAALLKSDYPKDIFASLVSSQFDADRLDYLQRDAYMTGTRQGRFDWSWLLDNVSIGTIAKADEAEGDIKVIDVETIVLDRKALSAAEEYLQGRFNLYNQVYLHKTTRGAEKVLGRCLFHISEALKNDHKPVKDCLGLNPLARYLSADGQTLANYVSLDDASIWTALRLLRSVEHPVIPRLASALLSRRLFKNVDFGDEDHSEQHTIRFKQKLQQWFADDPTRRDWVLVDETEVTPYKWRPQTGPRALEKLYVYDREHVPVDIATQSETLNESGLRRRIYRVYYDRDRPELGEQVKNIWKGAVR
jgi:uncharacterized protein